jgi:uncharacterized protein YprB with RNaseH-like and TPR domain
MDLEQKLQQLKSVCKKTERESGLERELEYLRRLDQIPRQLPSQRVSQSIEEYIEGTVERRDAGEFFLAKQALPFGRPYGKMRIGDVAASVLSPLDLFLKSVSLPDPSQLVFLDTETTGLAGDAGVCAFLIGLGTMEGTGFAVRQFFLRDYSEEKAALEAVAEALEAREGLVTFNGRAFDVPLLEARYTLARLPSPFSRLIHLDLLHPARQVWKLRLESCHLTHLEREILGVARDGDVPGSEIPGIYFDYLRTGDASGLPGVFFHNALDIISLAALCVEVAGLIRDAGCDAPSLASCAGLDLFSLSRIFARAGASDLSISMGRRAVAAGLPEIIEPRALWHLAAQYKLRREFDAALNLWIELTRRDLHHALAAYRELAVHYERRMADAKTALEYTEAALAALAGSLLSTGNEKTLSIHAEKFSHRRTRLQKRLERRCIAAGGEKQTDGSSPPAHRRGSVPLTAPG